MLKGKRHPDSDTFPQAVKGRVQVGQHQPLTGKYAILDKTQIRPPAVSLVPSDPK